MRLLSLIFLTFAVLLGVSFAVLNSEHVIVNYYIGTQRIPLSILMLGIFLFGMIVGFLISLCTVIKLKMELKRHYRAHG